MRKKQGKPGSSETDRINEQDQQNDPHESCGDAASRADEQKLRADLEAATEELKSMREQMLRAMADLDNTKKRLDREKVEFKKYAAESCVRRLLPIIDSLEQAVKTEDAHKNYEHLLEGMHLIQKQLLDVLRQEQVERIHALGELFDPHRHEALLQEATDDASKDNRVIEELQMGYTMHGKVLRSTMVKIGKYEAAEPC